MIKDSIFLGLNTHYLIKLDSGEEIEAVEESEIDYILPKGMSVKLHIKTRKVNVFTEDGTKNLLSNIV